MEEEAGTGKEDTAAEEEATREGEDIKAEVVGTEEAGAEVATAVATEEEEEEEDTLREVDTAARDLASAEGVSCRADGAQRDAS